jgi:heptosyltransferase-1
MKAPRILIVLMGALGDVVRGLSLVAQIKRAMPEAQVSWLIDSKWKSIVALHPQIDEIFEFDRSQPLYSLRVLNASFRKANFDICLDLQRHFKSGVLCRISRAARRIGFHRSDSKEGNWLFQTETIPVWNEKGAKLSQYLKFLSQIGITPTSDLDFGLSHVTLDTHGASLREKLPSRYLVFVLGASWQSKRWPIEGYQRVLEQLKLKPEVGVVLLGDAHSRQEAAVLVKKFPQVIDLLGNTSLPELVAVIHNAQLCLGPDSGPAHIAAAVKTPYVSLFGPTSAELVAPYGMEAFSISSPVGCAPCYRRRCPGLGNVCMRLHSPQLVAETIKRASPELATMLA